MITGSENGRHPHPPDRAGRAADRRSAYGRDFGRRPRYRHRSARRGALALARVLLTLGSVALALVLLHGDRGVLGPRPAAAPGMVPVVPFPSLPMSPTGPGARPGQAPPVELSIPVLGLRSPLDRLNANPDGTLHAATDPGTPGWYGGGPYPGDASSPPALIVGRSDRPAGVFSRLGELRPGNSVVVRAGDGHTSVFEVYKVIHIAGPGLPTGSVYATSTRAELRLVTRPDPVAGPAAAADVVVVYAALRSPEPTGPTAHATRATPTAPATAEGQQAPASPVPSTPVSGSPGPVAPPSAAPSPTGAPTGVPTGPAPAPGGPPSVPPAATPAPATPPPSGPPTPAPGGGLVRPT